MCGPAEADGLPPLRRRSSRAVPLQMRDFIDRNIDSPLGPAAAVRSPGSRRSAASAGSRRRSRGTCSDPRTQRVFSLPGDVRRAVPVRRARALRGHRLHGLGRRRVLPARRHARACPRAGRRGREARRRDPLRPPRSTGSSSRAAARRAVHHRRRRAGRLPTSWCSTPTCPSRTASCSAASRGGRGGCATRRPAVLLLAGSTRAYRRPAHHTIYFGRAWREVFDELIARAG